MSGTEWPAASVEARLETEDGICVLTYDDLNTAQIIDSVQDDRAGATAVFVGTTRNDFKGKAVTRLDYQAYSKVAVKTMANILHDVRAQAASGELGKPHPILKSAIHHRLGTVPVGQASIVVAVSTPHRAESFAACHLILDLVKEKAQIWKREFYEGEREEDAEWKENVSASKVDV